MSTLRPRTLCWIKRQTSQYDRNGRQIVNATSRRTKCAVVHLYDETEKTTVRADSSASRGRAEERLSDGRVLLAPREDIRTGDLIEIYVHGAENIVLEINRIFRRLDVNNVVHHIDVEGDKWVSA